MVDGGSRAASGQLDDWAAGVAADLDQGEGDRAGARRRPARDASPAPDARKVTTFTNKKRPASDRDSSPEEDDEEQAQKGSLKADGTRPKLPRPDKKEACPRCNSMDTKFCYYNNYNIKQPRFYCKTCQRYWTAGGTLRNIAPGSGRRKSKSKAAREKNSPSLAEQLTAVAAGQGMFGLGGGGGYNGISPALALAAATDPTGLLAANSAAAYGLGGHGTISGLKLGGVGGLPAQFNSELALREHLAGQHSLETRLLLNGHLSAEDLPNGMSAAALAQASAQLHALHGQGSGIAQSLAAGNGHTGSPSPSPPPAGNGGQQHPLSSSPQHGGGSQASQQPSPPQQGSDDAEGGGEERYVAQGRRVRVKAELDGNAVSSSLAMGGGGGSGAYANGASIASSIANAQLAASLSMPPSMGALAAVMGPGGGPSGLHPLLAQDNGGSLLDAGLTRQQLLVLQQHQAMQQAQQQESLQQLSSLQQLQGLAALHGQHSAAGLAGLDPLQRSALLHSAAGLGGVGVGGWLQGGGGGNSLAAAAALESLQAQHLLQAQQVHPSAAAALIGGGGSSAAAQMLQAQAAAAAAGGGGGWQGVASAANWPSAWSSYSGPSSGSYAGYALQAAAAYSGAR
ncbi:hypothetical protein CHLRE_12g521150v5 [Chlamydomonas reinhardtii]|uniref:Uncharacterized protein n=1 Tax=Chlamydomonas reinhardtii TaxID=3055 RepID=A8J5X0_CHLRE|nr:uncharacterized protein CHLRE_12g521150v5 [Chlamydomonas reinhardtii]PNW75296.1 hypothetical protein CHLRE_12g521150v5 [Chlamydomonas reinhardtii]|eukprot:XP_001696918.1 predicted protein [Chlamydomonas reinhardtii]